jgi:hypothetical protein
MTVGFIDLGQISRINTTLVSYFVRSLHSLPAARPPTAAWSGCSGAKDSSDGGFGSFVRPVARQVATAKCAGGIAGKTANGAALPGRTAAGHHTGPAIV